MPTRTLTDTASITWDESTPNQVKGNVVGGVGPFQPLDADLTAIAALNTDDYGRGLLEMETALEASAYIGARLRLTADTDYYVATTGNNVTGTGAIGAPWQTLQFAYDYVAKNIDLAGFDVNINLADGTYTAGLVVHMPLVSSADFGADSWHFRIRGNNANPQNVIVQDATGDAIANWQCGTRVWVKNLTVESATASGLAAYDNAFIAFENIHFGDCDESHIKTDRGGVIINELGDGSGYTITGDADNHYEASSGGRIQVRDSNTVTLTGTPAFTEFASIRTNSTLVVSGVTFTGAATGVRFAVESGGAIITGTDDFNFLPGNADGTFANGGIYDFAVASGVFIGNMDIEGALTVRSFFRLTADITPTTLAASANNYNPTDLATASCLRLSASTPVDITGLAGGADGRILIIHNVGATNAITLVNNSGSSTASNIFLFDANLVLAANQSVTIRYDSTSAVWRRI